MPILDFQCHNCKNIIRDKLVMDIKVVPACPKCGCVMTRIYSVGDIGVHGDLPGNSYKKEREKHK